MKINMSEKLLMEIISRFIVKANIPDEDLRYVRCERDAYLKDFSVDDMIELLQLYKILYILTIK